MEAWRETYKKNKALTEEVIASVATKRSVAAGENSCPSTGSAAEGDVERTFFVAVSAPGWNGRFTLPQRDFNELTSFLTHRACAEKPPNEKGQP